MCRGRLHNNENQSFWQLTRFKKKKSNPKLYILSYNLQPYVSTIITTTTYYRITQRVCESIKSDKNMKLCLISRIILLCELQNFIFY